MVVDPEARRLVFDEVDDPVAGSGQLLVRVGAAGVNRADLAVTAGKYLTGRSARRFVAGGELAGEVVAVGEGVDGWSVGDRVMAMGPGFAELAVIPAAVAMPVPDGLDDVGAGALPGRAGDDARRAGDQRAVRGRRSTSSSTPRRRASAWWGCASPFASARPR